MTPNSKRILIVDDDADFAEAVSSFLTAHGYLVIQARDGQEGLRLAQTERPDLVLMDVMMRERTEGFFTVQQMRRMPELSAVPVFIVTSLYSHIPEFRITPDSSWLAHDEFLPKPVDFPELLEKIRRRLRVETPEEAAS